MKFKTSKMIYYFVLICFVLFKSYVEAEPSERLPNPLAKEDYETFKNILEDGGQ